VVAARAAGAGESGPEAGLAKATVGVAGAEVFATRAFIDLATGAKSVASAAVEAAGSDESADAGEAGGATRGFNLNFPGSGSAPILVVAAAETGEGDKAGSARAWAGASVDTEIGASDRISSAVVTAWPGARRGFSRNGGE
jgi:hypothetical protein